MSHQVTIQKQVATVVESSERVLAVASMFGLGVDRSKVINIVAPATIDLRTGEVIFITGPSGCGKSTALSLIEAEATNVHADVRVHRVGEGPVAMDRPLVDCLDNLPLDRAMQVFCAAGLGDAFVMLRKPSQLSDGQRHRLQLAEVMAAIEATQEISGGENEFHLVLADEFAAPLDRITAKVIAHNIRKWVDRLTARDVAICFVAASTHDDLLEALRPDQLIDMSLDGEIDVHRRAESITS